MVVQQSRWRLICLACLIPYPIPQKTQAMAGVCSGPTSQASTPNHIPGLAYAKAVAERINCVQFNVSAGYHPVS